MNSIRTKTTLLTVCAIVAAMAASMFLAVTAIRDIGSKNSEDMLLLLCESGEKNLDFYFESVEQSVETVSSFVEADLEDLGSLDANQLAEHVQRVNEIFGTAARKTNGVLTYYYRIDPSVSRDVKGFWYTNLEGNAFVEHEVTDIALYDTQDTTRLVWFTVPKATGEPVWLSPYITDNLGVRVISYNAPIYRNGQFIGVVGIEIDYTAMAELVNSIRLYDNGYAFINDAELTVETKPKVPHGLISDETFITYDYEGVVKQAVWLPLSNGMRLNVAVPVAEINKSWQNLIFEILVVSATLLLVFIVVTMRFTGRITKPLRELTEVAEQVDAGNYDVNLQYGGNDEVGILTRTVNRLVSDLKVYIGDLNSLAYADALTSVRNKGAFDIYIRDLQAKMDDPNEQPAFAVCMFDCDDLKAINDQRGHDKGDVYLKVASKLICHVFQHSPVFRIGGDEFAAILQGDDYRMRDELISRFAAESAAANAAAEHPWEEVRVSVGLALFDPQTDLSANDVARRADKLMYEDKRKRKGA